MPGKKKTNFISYELERLDKYVKQLTSFLDKNPPDRVQDRLEVIDGPRGPIVKIISKKEEQIKLFMEMLQKLPAVLEDVNRLRKGVDGEEVTEVRGGHGLPGFMTLGEESGTYKNDETVDVSEDGFDDDEAISVEAEEMPEDNTPVSPALLQGIAQDFYNLEQQDLNPEGEEATEEEDKEDEDPEWDDED